MVPLPIIDGVFSVGMKLIERFFPDPATADAAKLKLEGDIMKTVDGQLGAVARPARVRFVTALPKTRSGKLLRRSIQALCEGRDPGDLTTIEDPGALEQIRAALGTKEPA